tara:strand:+ start:187 stop:687 length:501 start_codon:yes stop_codon:yes gene_type:complete
MVNEELKQDLEQYANENSNFPSDDPPIGSTMTTLEQLTSGQDIYSESQSGIKQISDGLIGYDTVEEVLSRGNLNESEVNAVKILMLKDIRRQEMAGQKISKKHYKLINEMETEGGKASMLSIMLSGSVNGGFWETFISGVMGHAYKIVKKSFGFGGKQQQNNFNQQ